MLEDVFFFFFQPCSVEAHNDGLSLDDYPEYGMSSHISDVQNKMVIQSVSRISSHCRTNILVCAMFVQ